MGFLTARNHTNMSDQGKTAFIRSLTLPELSTFKMMDKNLLKISKTDIPANLSNLNPIRVQQRIIYLLENPAPDEATKIQKAPRNPDQKLKLKRG